MQPLKLPRVLTKEADELLRGTNRKGKASKKRAREGVESDYDPEHFFHSDKEVKVLKEEDGSLLFWLLPKTFDEPLLHKAYDYLKTVHGSCTDRPEVTGTKNQKQRWKDGKISKQLRVDPKTRKRYWDEGCRADYLGWMDDSGKGRFKYCRQTAWTTDHPEILSNMRKCVEVADRTFKEHLLEAYLRQWNHIADSPEFQIYGTAFSTITVNKLLSTTYHRDEGDYVKGFGVMFTFGDFTGGQLVFPAFRCAVDYQPGSMILADVHETHGNVKNIVGDRITCVLYARQHIDKCGRAEDEEKRVAGRMSVHVRED
jgi:hypothetical protein